MHADKMLQYTQLYDLNTHPLSAPAFKGHLDRKVQEYSSDEFLSAEALDQYAVKWCVHKPRNQQQPLGDEPDDCYLEVDDTCVTQWQKLVLISR